MHLRARQRLRHGLRKGRSSRAASITTRGSSEQGLSSSCITGYAKSHLFNIRRVAMAWPPAERSYNISFTTYLHLLREKDDATRRLLVAKAIRERWTPESAVAYFAGRRAGTVGPPEPEPELAVPDVIAPAAPMVPTPAPPELPKPRAPRVRKTGGRPGRPPTRKVKCPHCGEVFPLYGHEVPRGDPDA
jgi:hypothetical protein